MIRTALVAFLVSSFLLPALIVPAVAQPKIEAAKVQAKQPKKKQTSRRLPPYYSKVVNDGQREQIYRIQADYNARIEELRAQLDLLLKERDDKVRAVLSPQQIEQLDALAAQAQGVRAAKAAQKAEEMKRKAQPGPAAKNNKAKKNQRRQ